MFQKKMLLILLISVHFAACGQDKRSVNKYDNEKVKTTKMENKMKIEIWSDVVCPYCYIGKRKFEKAFGQFADSVNVEIVWKSYQLQPDMPGEYTQNIYTLVSEKYGIPLEQSKGLHDRLTLAARDLGLEYNFDKVKPANTLKAHQVIQFAKINGKQDEAEEALFHAYFTDGKDINNVDTLLNIGGTIGLNVSALKDALDNGKFIPDIQSDIDEARQVGVEGVPFFVFNKKNAVSGAQDSRVFLEALQKSFAEWRKNNSIQKMEVTEGAACSPGRQCQ